MELIIENLGIKFGDHYLYQNLNKTLMEGQSWAVTGKNGSGKSTLLQLIAGTLQATKGTVNHRVNKTDVEAEHWYKHTSIAAPYIHLLEDLTLDELLTYHFRLKKMSINKDQLKKELDLENQANKSLHNFSSGMKQRLKLGLALYSESALVLLDEPTSNLDQYYTEWYTEKIKDFNDKGNKITIVFSNLPLEYSWCEEVYSL